MRAPNKQLEHAYGYVRARSPRVRLMMGVAASQWVELGEGAKREEMGEPNIRLFQAKIDFQVLSKLEVY